MLDTEKEVDVGTLCCEQRFTQTITSRGKHFSQSVLNLNHVKMFKNSKLRNQN